MKIEPSHKVLITVGIAIILVIGLYLISSTITKLTGYAVSNQVNKDSVNSDFTACLEEQEIKFYIETENSNEALKNNEIIPYLPNLEIMNCERNKEFCEYHGIMFFPTWIINDKIITGELTIENLLEISGC